MRFKLIFLILLIASFVFGGYLWKVSNRISDSSEYQYEKSAPISAETKVAADLVVVGKKPITTAELEWEFKLHTAGLDDVEELTPIPEISGKYATKLEPLKQMLLAGIIERRLLYQYIKTETKFNAEDPSRFIKCLEDWQNIVAMAPEPVSAGLGAERLKARLCESSIIKQYIKEELFAKIKIKDAVAKDYFDNNIDLFRKPAMVTIRHIVTASEGDARKIRYKLNRGNFASYAKQYSIAPEAAEGGKLGPFAKGEMPAVFDVTFSMRRGQIRGILKSTYGFHIFMLEKKHKKRDLSFAEAKNEVIRLFKEEQQEKLYQDLVENALSSIEVKPPKPLW